MDETKTPKTFRGQPGFREQLFALQHRFRVRSINTLLIVLIEKAHALPVGSIQMLKAEAVRPGGRCKFPGRLATPITLRATDKTWALLDEIANREGVSLNVALVGIASHYSK